MSRDRLKREIHKRLRSPITDPLPWVRDFIVIYFGTTETQQEAETLLREDAGDFARDTLVRQVEALRLFIADEKYQGLWLNTVEWEANRALKNPSPETARDWIENVCKRTEEILDQTTEE